MLDKFTKVWYNGKFGLRTGVRAPAALIVILNKKRFGKGEPESQTIIKIENAVPLVTIHKFFTY